MSVAASHFIPNQVRARRRAVFPDSGQARRTFAHSPATQLSRRSDKNSKCRAWPPWHASCLAFAREVDEPHTGGSNGHLHVRKHARRGPEGQLDDRGHHRRTTSGSTSRKPFMPESLARVEPLDFLSPDERLTLNQIRGPRLPRACSASSRSSSCRSSSTTPGRSLAGDDYRDRALLQFAERGGQAHPALQALPRRVRARASARRARSSARPTAIAAGGARPRPARGGARSSSTSSG